MELSQPTIFLSSANINIIGDSSNDNLVMCKRNETLNGENTADFEITLSGVKSLIAGDSILLALSKCYK